MASFPKFNCPCYTSQAYPSKDIIAPSGGSDTPTSIINLENTWQICLLDSSDGGVFSTEFSSPQLTHFVTSWWKINQDIILLI